jgi:DNA repair exonuclease SbcCD ATPase subunit
LELRFTPQNSSWRSLCSRTDGKIASIGSATFANAETWRAIAAEAEKAARAEFLKSSAELSELERLETVAAEARKAADAKERELQALWSEFQSIPEKAEKLNDRLNAITNELRALDSAKIEADFKAMYKNVWQGAMVDPFAQMQLAGLLVTAPLRKEVLNSLAEELQTQLADMKARHKALSRKLGQRSTI